MDDDGARTQLAKLTDRDSILSFFFDQARSSFDFCVLFLVRSGNVQGRYVSGLGAPPDLVARLQLPIGKPGIVTRACTSTEPFVATPATDGADTLLIGHLGRAMPTVVVVPLLVKGRVVAFVVGSAKSTEAARAEVAALAQLAGEAFERLIARRKAEGRDSASVLEPVSRRSLPSVPTSSPEVPISRRPEPAPRGTTRWPWILGGVALVAAVIAVVATQLSTPPDPDTVAVAGPKLAGWPSNIDLNAVIERSRGVSGLGANAELVAVVVQPGDNGVIDSAVPSRDATGAIVKILWTRGDTESEVRVTKQGMYNPQTHPRVSDCNDYTCGASVALPTCTPAQIWAASGAKKGDAATLVYASGELSGVHGPQWAASVDPRGTVRIDASTCKPFPRERLRPPSIPLASIPGAPRTVDPLAALAMARAQSALEDAVLLEIDAFGVTSSGVVDFGDTMTERRIVYTFADSESAGAQRRWRRVTIDAQGMPIVQTDHDREQIPLRYRNAAPTPRATFQRAWKMITTRSQAPAHITYEGGDGAGQWTIEIPGAQRQTYSDKLCAAM